ncbi:MAG TPA: DNA mismatch repair endonuclease MutL [Anaerohalosphaeraceae bacterium]|jgi:DNA mismatch repair protein MutL|nr:DNA mismatch repair endonuclease MutL [Anaerohalosphaeraceae bacterium]HRT48869.1 DNA mismatch repair endonuclease MutL [Anaerohalosphaeraceae bacterium]HRT84992.1 DNA mismatch repair endonuclease MutL [Anaerohalosphaeraceae bacterium]
MSRIRVLDENLINMIAAGEVIERPASVVKELLENSIDAGATRIIVRIEDGGRRCITVTDDGAGMDGDDLAMAFKPHATSKIASSEDLSGIRTMGFRGEALASIASVSQVHVVTRLRGAHAAHEIEIDCGTAQAVRPCAGDYGTTIEVRNLFYKVPARRKFLRTANTEMQHIIECFTRVALAHFSLDMTLEHNGRQIYRVLSNQGLRERIAELLSRQVAEDLLEAESREKGMRIFALLGKPAGARASAKFQYVFLNGRYIRDKFISHAVREAYRGVIEPNKFPVVFLFLEMSPEVYDVNVHPTKIEVRFENANLVHSQVLAVLREKLLSTNLDTTARIRDTGVRLTEDPESSFAEAARRERITQAMADFFKTNKPATGAQQRFKFTDRPEGTADVRGHAPGPALSRAAAALGCTRGDQVRCFERESTNGQGAQNNKATQRDTAFPAVDTGREFLQLHNSYIVTQVDDGFVIVDQHALHERILYEELCRRLSEGPLPSQRLLIPETFDVNDAEIDAIQSNSELIGKLGIELEPFGPRTMAIQAFPTMLSDVGALAFVRDLLDMLTDRDMNLDTERLLHEVLDMAACKAAIKAGQPLSAAEIRQLLADKETIERASHCPHGRPTTIRFTLAELEKQFKRT